MRPSAQVIARQLTIEKMSDVNSRLLRAQKGNYRGYDSNSASRRQITNRSSGRTPIERDSSAPHFLTKRTFDYHRLGSVVTTKANQMPSVHS